MYIKDVSLNCLSWFLVSCILGNMKTWENFEYPSLSTTIYKSTAFGKFFHELRSNCEESTLASSSQTVSSDLNPYFKPDLLDYLVRHILPYSPLLTHIMFKSTGDKHEFDHNNPVENWNRTVKVVEHGKKGLQKIGQFIHNQKEMLEGTLVVFKICKQCTSFSYSDIFLLNCGVSARSSTFPGMF